MLHIKSSEKCQFTNNMSPCDIKTVGNQNVRFKESVASAVKLHIGFNASTEHNKPVCLLTDRLGTVVLVINGS